MSTLVHCVYSSAQTRMMSKADIAELVQHSRSSNLRRGITGILLHVEGTFFQILEGPSEVLDELYAKILVDPRHTRITRVIFEPIPRRYFADSTMNLLTISPSELGEIVEGRHTNNRGWLLTGLDEGRSKRVLQAFVDGRWRAQMALPRASPEVNRLGTT